MCAMRKIEMMKYPNDVAENAVICEEYKSIANDFSEQIVNEFISLCAIPHPSGHVEEMRQYLLDWAKKNNVEHQLDSSGCIYMDLPATEGYEDKPKIIFQAHFDMVAVASKHNTTFDPLTSPIKPFIDEESGTIHTNWKTSLGADDGHGIATMLAMVKLHNDKNIDFQHGPIRLLFTYDEETTLQGCKLLNKEVVDSRYLINLDSIYVGMIITSAAGGFYATAKKKMDRMDPGKKSNVISLEIWGLLGGHSGADIAKNRGNTLAILTEYFTRLLNENINFNIRYIKSGLLMNAIPAKMLAEIVVGYHDAENARRIAEEIILEAKEKYSDGNSLLYNLELREASAKPVLSISDSMKIYHLLTMLPIGVIEKFENGQVKTSNNVGVLEIYDDVLNCEILYRSTDKDQLKFAVQTILDVSLDNDIDFTIESIFPAWPKTKNNPLNKLIAEAFEKTSDIQIDTLDIHAGLENGYLIRKNPDLIMASIGCDIVNEHSRKETFFTKSLPTYTASLLYTLKNLK